eukprot:121073_1
MSNGTIESKENVDSNEFINYHKFKERILTNKRIWSYIAAYAILYYSSRRFLQPWYDKSTMIKGLSKMDDDPVLLENLIGSDAHKPASNVSILLNSIAHIILIGKYRNISTQTVINCIKEEYKNTDKENHIIDIHIAIWSFLLFIDTTYYVRTKKKISNADKLMFWHHISALITSCMLKYKNISGPQWCWIGFWSEGIGTLSLIGGLMRVYYQKKRPDLTIVRHISDVIFGIFICLMTYARCIGFTRVQWYWTMAWCRDEKKGIASKIWVGALLPMLSLGWWWTIQSWRVIGEKIVDEIKALKQ